MAAIHCSNACGRLSSSVGMNSSAQLLTGHVMHRRLRPVEHEFRYPVFYVTLPLRHLETAGNAIFGINRGRLLSFRDADHGPRDGNPLLPWVENILHEHGLPDDGEILLQTFPRLFGYVFNPVSFWFCHDRSGALIAVLAEVNNTFGGHHNYLLHNIDGSPLEAEQVFNARKAFHVSPFCDVAGSYRFRFDVGNELQSSSIDYDDGEGDLLLTSISGSTRPLTVATLLGALLRMPLLTLGIIARIHWQALRLWLKGVHFYGKTPASSLQESTK